MKILILNGPNLNLLGKRDNSHYGNLSLEEIQNKIKIEFPDDDFEFFQSNLEGELINKIQNAENSFDGIIINPGGYAHTSVAIKDSLNECKIQKVEVHLSNLAAREDYRKTTLTASSCEGYISGFQDLSYISGIFTLKKLIQKKEGGTSDKSDNI